VVSSINRLLFLSTFVISVKDTTLVGGDHILDVDEGIFSTMHFKDLESSLDQVTEIQILALRVLDLVTKVGVLGLEQVKNGQDLTVVGHEGFTNGVRAGNESL